MPLKIQNLIERFGERRAAAVIAAQVGNGDEDETAENGDDTVEGADATESENDDGGATESEDDGDASTDADDADGSDDAGEDAGDPGAADPAEVAAVCAEAGRPELTEVLIREKASAENVLVRLDKAQQIVAAVTMARKINPAIDTAEADTLIAANATPHHAKVVLFDKIIAAQSPDISNTHQPGNRPAGVANEHGWDGIVADYNAKQKRR